MANTILTARQMLLEVLWSIKARIIDDMAFSASFYATINDIDRTLYVRDFADDVLQPVIAALAEASSRTEPRDLRLPASMVSSEAALESFGGLFGRIYRFYDMNRGAVFWKFDITWNPVVEGYGWAA